MGSFLGFFSLILFIWVHKSLGANFSRKIRIAKEQGLVISRPYRFLRHPMYSAFYLLHFAVFFITSNWFLEVSWTFFLTVIIFLRINREEKLLIEKFKEEYLFLYAEDWKVHSRVLEKKKEGGRTNIEGRALSLKKGQAPEAGSFGPFEAISGRFE